MKSGVRAALSVLILAGVQSETCTAQEDGATERFAGKYSVLIQEDCVFSPAGFGPAPLFEALGPTTRGTATIQGAATLKKDGTGDIVGRSAFIGTNPALTPALGMTVSCPITYTVGTEDTFDAHYNCTGVTTIGTGARIALETFQNGMQVSGHVRRKDLVLAASTRLAIENVGSLAAPPVPRMCHRTFQLMRIEATAQPQG